ncbi:MAG: hypothetical protein QM776_03155 [Rhodocyclaceae bacterium]
MPGTRRALRPLSGTASCAASDSACSWLSCCFALSDTHQASPSNSTPSAWRTSLVVLRVSDWPWSSKR